MTAYIPYAERLGRLPDFEVTYQLFSAEEGGRGTPAYQGTRWNFRYDEKLFRDGMYMIYPEVIDQTTQEPYRLALPLPTYGIATMWILNPTFRSLHQQRIKVGTRGYWMEGSIKVAVCEVIRIIGLFSNHTK